MGTYGSPTSKPSVAFGTASFSQICKFATSQTVLVSISKKSCHDRPWIGKLYCKLTAKKLKKIKRSKKYQEFRMVRRYKDKSGQMKVYHDLIIKKEFPVNRNVAIDIEFDCVCTLE